MFEEYKQIITESDVWIGEGAIIIGVAVLRQVQQAAGAVATKNVPPYTIVRWIPAKVIKYRFEKKINRILHTKWWNLDPDEAQKVMEEIM